MRRLLLVAVVLLAGIPVHALDAEVRVGGGYLWLLTPGLDDVDARPRTNIHRGGGAVSFQIVSGSLPGAPGVRFGTEVGYLRMYRFDTIDGHPDEGTLVSMPVLALFERVFSPDADVSPSIQAGFGASFNKRELEYASAIKGRDTMKDTDWAIMAGPGIVMRVSEKMSFDAALKYYILFGKGGDKRALGLLLSFGFKL